MAAPDSFKRLRLLRFILFGPCCGFLQCSRFFSFRQVAVRADIPTRPPCPHRAKRRLRSGEGS